MKEVIKASHSMEHKDPAGRLIYAEKTPRRFKKLQDWDAWRSGICNTSRNDRLCPGFREGNANPLTLLYSLVLKIIGGKHVKQIGS
jgi:hypothetical protein